MVTNQSSKEHLAIQSHGFKKRDLTNAINQLKKLGLADDFRVKPCIQYLIQRRQELEAINPLEK